MIYTKTETSLYPFGAIQDLDTLNKTIKHQGYEKPLNYEAAQNVVLNSFLAQGEKPPKLHCTNLAQNYISQFSICVPVIEDKADYKALLKGFSETVIKNVSQVKKITDLEMSIIFRVTGERVDFTVMQGSTPIYGQQTRL